jgi:hydrogenase maturation protease
MILVAGVGNVLLGDDGFGVEVARRLSARAPAGATVRDFGIRGLDLAYALCEPWDAVILVDAAMRGKSPGTLTVIEPTTVHPEPVEGSAPQLPLHNVDPVSVLKTAQALGATLPPLRVLACEPERMLDDDEALTQELSPAVAAAIDPALEMIETLIAELRHA